MVLTICSLRTFLLLSLFGPTSLGHGSRRAAQPPPTMLGHGSEVQESMLGHGSAVRKICWVTEVQYEKYAGSRKCSTKNMLGHGRPPRLARRAALVAPSPAGLLGCFALPCPSLISIHTPPFSRGRTFVLGLAKRLASSRRSSLPRSPLSPSPSLLSLTLVRHCEMT